MTFTCVHSRTPATEIRLDTAQPSFLAIKKKRTKKLRDSARIPYGVNIRLSSPLSPDECLSRILTRFRAEYVWPLYGTLLSRSFPSDQRGSKRANKLCFASGGVFILYVLPLYNRLVYTKHPLFFVYLSKCRVELL